MDNTFTMPTCVCLCTSYICVSVNSPHMCVCPLPTYGCLSTRYICVCRSPQMCACTKSGSVFLMSYGLVLFYVQWYWCEMSSLIFVELLTITVYISLSIKNICLSMCDENLFLTFASLGLVLLWQLFYLFCSSFVISSVIVTAATFEP